MQVPSKASPKPKKRRASEMSPPTDPAPRQLTAEGVPICPMGSGGVLEDRLQTLGWNPNFSGNYLAYPISNQQTEYARDSSRGGHCSKPGTAEEPAAGQPAGRVWADLEQPTAPAAEPTPQPRLFRQNGRSEKQRTRQTNYLLYSPLLYGLPKTVCVALRAKKQKQSLN